MPPTPPPGPKHPYGQNQPEPEPDPPEFSEEEEQVIAWRYVVLQAAGWDEPEARTLAHRLDVDLHDACRLLVNGCDPTTALDILL